MSNNAVWSFDDARAACRAASKAQEAVEEELRRAAQDFAVKEESYRVALAKRIVELRADGQAASLCADLARGTKDVAKLRMLRDIAEGVLKAMEHAAWRRNHDRKDTARFVAWSQARELAEAGPGHEQPRWTREAA